MCPVTTHPAPASAGSCQWAKGWQQATLPHDLWDQLSACLRCDDHDVACLQMRTAWLNIRRCQRTPLTTGIGQSNADWCQAFEPSKRPFQHASASTLQSPCWACASGRNRTRPHWWSEARQGRAGSHPRIGSCPHSGRSPMERRPQAGWSLVFWTSAASLTVKQHIVQQTAALNSIDQEQANLFYLLRDPCMMERMSENWALLWLVTSSSQLHQKFYFTWTVMNSSLTEIYTAL